jgi:hypothetical protein
MADGYAVLLQARVQLKCHDSVYPKKLKAMLENG